MVSRVIAPGHDSLTSILKAEMRMTADDEKREYEASWTGNARSYAAQGCYEWMAAQLDTFQPKRVLDIGCGTGEGLVSLHRRFRCGILSIDENAYCLRSAAAAMRGEGAKVQVKERYDYLDYDDGRHLLGVRPGPIELSREVMLVQGDILLEDHELFRFIESKATFDAVTIWLTGALMGRQTCINLDNIEMKDIAEYRLRMQNKAYELAARVLRHGGALQVVDRGEIPETDDLRNEFCVSHQEQASATDLVVQGVVFRPYDELTGGKGIRVLPTPPCKDRQMPAKFVSGMNSVVSLKP
jgi:SAM-dependent methyltransferase